MLTQLTPAQHERLRPLFAGFGARVHGCAEAVFSGEFGPAWADDVDAPAVALAHIGWSDVGFSFVAGDSRGAEALEAVRMVPAGSVIVSSDPSWNDAVRETLGHRAEVRTRTATSTPPTSAWDRELLRTMAATLPAGHAIRRVTGSDIDAFADVEADLIGNFRTRQAFLERGLGFGVWYNGRCVAGCSSYTLANGKLEIEIDTRPEFRRRGLARAVAAALILHCLDHGIEPCWDAHNPESLALALQLGFVDPEPYPVFEVSLPHPS